MPNYKRYYLNNYSYIFITMVTYQRKGILIENIELLRDSFRKALSKYDFEIIAICILKNHIHMIIKENELKNFSKIIAIIKKNFSYYLENKPLKNDLPKSLQYRKEAGVWQRRFYDHIIRNEEDLHRHIDYIHYNSIKHHNIKPKDWKYSSFKKFVENQYYDIDWCNFNDKQNILNMNLE